MFKKKKGINLSYNKQGLIYFTCLDVDNQPLKVQQKIINLCIEVGGEDYRALYELLTSDRAGVESVARRHFIPEATLCKMRKKFYEKW